MKKILYTLFILSIIAFNLNCQNNTLTSEKIWNNYLKTIGDMSSVMKIKTYAFTSENNRTNGKSIIHKKIKYPDKVFQEMIFENDTITYIYNGGKGIIKSKNSINPMTDENIASMKTTALIFAEFYFSELGYKIELIGETIIEKVNCWQIRVESKFDTFNYFIRKDNFELHQISHPILTLKIIESSTYKGVTYLKTYKNIYDTDTIIINRIDNQFNIELSDEIFSLE